MLVLSRKPNQSIIVDGPCRITVLDSKCKLGIDGKAKVLREELVPYASTSIAHSPTVYIVDDNADVLHAYQCYLVHYGFNVRPFTRGGEFLERIKEEADASAAVLDLRLAEEDIDGLQILRQLRTWHHDYPVILLTGYGDVETCRRAFQNGCYTFLQKPLAPQELATTIKEAVFRYEHREIDERHCCASPAG